MRCIKAAQEAIQRGRYTECKAGDEILRKEWFTGMDSVSAFVDDCLTHRGTASSGLTPKDMRTAYERYCQQSGYRHPVVGKKLTQALARAGVAQDEKPTQGAYRYSHCLNDEYSTITDNKPAWAPF
jgi:phage/plasmid-associated DNA primase